METQQVRRRSNGTIDVDFYRRKAFVLRRSAMTEFLTGVGPLVVRPLIAVAALAIAVSLMPTPAPTPAGAVAISPGAAQSK